MKRSARTAYIVIFSGRLLKRRAGPRQAGNMQRTLVSNLTGRKSGQTGRGSHFGLKMRMKMDGQRGRRTGSFLGPESDSETEPNIRLDRAPIEFVPHPSVSTFRQQVRPRYAQAFTCCLFMLFVRCLHCPLCMGRPTWLD